MSEPYFLIDHIGRLYFYEGSRRFFHDHAYYCVYPIIPLIKGAVHEVTSVTTDVAFLTMGGRIGLMDKYMKGCFYLDRRDIVSIHEDIYDFEDSSFRFLIIDSNKNLFRARIEDDYSTSYELLDTEVDGIINTGYDGYGCLKGEYLHYKGKSIHVGKIVSSNKSGTIVNDKGKVYSLTELDDGPIFDNPRIISSNGCTAIYDNHVMKTKYGSEVQCRIVINRFLEVSGELLIEDINGNLYWRKGITGSPIEQPVYEITFPYKVMEQFE